MSNWHGDRVRKVVLWCVAAIVVLVLFVQATRMVLHGREGARRSNVVGRLYQVAFMIRNYEGAEGAPPPVFSTSPEGEKLLSWRALVFLFDGPDGNLVGVRLDEPWNSSTNRIAAARNSDKSSYFSFPNSQPDSTAQILAVVGPNSLWDATTGLPKGKLKEQSEMVMLVARDTAKFHWMEPRDIHEDDLRRLLDTGEVIFGISTLGKYGIVTTRDGRLAIDPNYREAF